jgi:hypothetical protein
MNRADLTKPDGLAAYLGMGVKKIGHKVGLSGPMLRDDGGHRENWNESKPVDAKKPLKKHKL